MSEFNELTAQVNRLQKEVDDLRIKNLVSPQLYKEATEQDEFENLKLLLSSSFWPAAISPELICDLNSDEDKHKRANKILDTIDTPIEFLKVLDFGCGEGHVVHNALKQKPAKIVGYDLQASPTWNEWQTDTCVLTTKWDEVVKNGPYNVVLMYDVIDHLEPKEQTHVQASPTDPSKNILECLGEIREVMENKAKLYVCCHPWCSRHATHMYHNINKAYIHLVFTDVELEEMGYPRTIKMSYNVTLPNLQYANWFRKAKLTSIRSDRIERKTESFFKDTPIVRSRIKANWVGCENLELANGVKFPEFQTAVEFLHYVLLVKK